MTGEIDSSDLLAALNQQVKAVNDLCGCLAVTVNVSSTFNVGITIEQDPGTEGGSPPAGAGPPDPITDRKCLITEILYDDIETIITNLKDNPLSISLFDLIELGIALAPYINQGTLYVGETLQGIWGWLVDFAVTMQLNLQLLDFTDMLAKWQANKNQLICDMYDSTSPSAVRTAMTTTLAALSSAEISLITDTWLTNDVLNTLYFSVGNSESIISAFTGTLDCEAICNPCTEIEMIYGSFLGDSPDTPGRHRFETESQGTTALMQVRFNCANITLVSWAKQSGLNLDNNEGVRWGSTSALPNVISGLNCTNADVRCAGNHTGVLPPNVGNIQTITIHRGEASPAAPQWIDYEILELSP
jgi:hypothetical protein